MKYIPNGLSIARIFFALSLPFFVYQQIIFLIVYFLCGFTDILDGYLARKFHVESLFGSKLDSIADTAMFLIITYLIVINEYDLLKPYIPLLIVLFLIKFINFILAYLKQKTFFSVHTWANKLSGMLLFLILFFLDNNFFIYFLCCVSTFAAIEEFLIHLILPNVDINRKSFFFN